MRLKTRLMATAITMVVLPLILIVIATVGITALLRTGGHPLSLEEFSTFLAYMLVATAIILMMTAMMLTFWIREGFLKPIIEISSAMEYIKDGRLDYALTIGEDDDEITQMYRNYEEMRLRLKENTEEKMEHELQNRELVSNISHDLKTPITAIKGYAQGLIEGVADTPDKQMRYVRTIYNKASDMDNLINELTLYASIDNDRIPYNFHVINVAHYFGDCIEDIGMELESKSIRINYSNLTAPDTEIVADAEQMKRVINNIIGNSVKYLGREDDSGVIDIRILDEIDSVRIEIEDNGKGIPQKDIPNIFDRFYRSDASRNSKQGGSGIGLSIVKKIVEDHGGYIWATSVEGEGTCMHIVIRKHVPAPEGMAGEEEEMVVKVVKAARTAKQDKKQKDSQKKKNAPKIIVQRKR